MLNAGKTIFKCLRGSHATGIATAQSDRDYFEIIIPCVDALIGLKEAKGSQHKDVGSGEDVRIITLKELIRSALQGRSTEIECLFCREQDILGISHPEGSLLLENREKLVSQRLLRSLLGFSTGQRAKTFNGNKDRFREDLGYDPKSAAHGIRAMWQAIRLKQTGQLKFYIEDKDWRQIIVDVKEGLKTRHEVERIMNLQELLFKSHPENLSLQKEPDYNFWNSFLIKLHSNIIQEGRN